MKTKFLACVCVLGALAQAAPLTVTLHPGDPLEKGRQAIRDARKEGRLGADEPATVILSPGVYALSRRFELGAGDGGKSEKGRVVYKAEKPGTVKVRGARAIPSSAFKPAAGLPQGVRAADVSRYLLAPLKPWPDVCEGIPPGPWLYAHGAPLPLARWPNEGWAVFTNAYDKGENGPGAFFFEGERHKAWDVSQGLWMAGYWTHDWADTYHRIKSIDTVSNIVFFTGKSVWGVARGTWGMKERRFYAVNILSELDAPGEWFLDRKASKLYYYPDPGKESQDVMLASFDQSLVKLLENVRHVRFENIDFEYSHAPGDAAVWIDRGHDIHLTGCTFSNLAGPAVNISQSTCCRVSGCRIWHTGGTAVLVSGGNREALLPSRNVIEQTDIGFYGTFKRTFQPAISLRGCGGAIRGCHIHDGPYIALWYFGNEHLIAENVFERVVLEAGDSAAIYSGRDASSWGNLVFGNTIRELGADSAMARYRMGVYLDDCDCGDTLIGNVFSGMGHGIFVGGGNGIHAANNVISNCENAIHLDSRGHTWKLYTAAPGGNSWWHNTLKPFDYRAYPWCVAYPDALRMVDDHPNLPWMNVFSGNACIGCKSDYDFDRMAQTVTNRMVLVKTPHAQPVRLTDAACARLEKGPWQARFALDDAGRFSWRLDKNGAPYLLTSPLGFTVDARDYGKCVVPRAARYEKAQAYEGCEIPLADLCTGETVAYFDVRLHDERVLWRWRIPGSATRRIRGEVSAWCAAPGVKPDISQEKTDTSFPAAWCAPRAKDAWSLVYPLEPSGFAWTGEIVTPWRVTR